MNEPQVLKPTTIANSWHYFFGLIFLCLNKIRHALLGYKTPRTFSFADIPQAVAYDKQVVYKWKEYLRDYTNDQFTWANKNILELGPGADLGNGLILLSEGAAKYNALDVHNLVKNTPPEFYSYLLSHLPSGDKGILKRQLELTQQGGNDKLNFICEPNFDLTVLKNENIDIVVSQAAFEHFTDVKKTISQLSQIVKPGTIFLAEIDLKTHTRWIRDIDPLNIYRYNDRIYNFFKFQGSPNRLRPDQYQQILWDNGWTKVTIKYESILDSEYTKKVVPSLDKQFHDLKSSMNCLSLIIWATKK
ncbi:MAG: methyltransferase domain-containing protein [Candidatus Parcubacteria bacterium]|nr:methyltransferase domain-containing protein [Candidatus Parcubacteria bacterium]